MICAVHQMYSNDQIEGEDVGSLYGERRNGYRDLVRGTEGKRPLGKPRSRREGNNEVELKIRG